MKHPALFIRMNRWNKQVLSANIGLQGTSPGYQQTSLRVQTLPPPTTILRSGHGALQAAFRHRIASIFLLTCIIKSFFTEKIRCHLGHKHYQLIWKIVFKFPDVMEKSNERYHLTASIEPDEDFFTIERLEYGKNKP